MPLKIALVPLCIVPCGRCGAVPALRQSTITHHWCLCCSHPGWEARADSLLVTALTPSGAVRKWNRKNETAKTLEGA